jgi:hypothetical protein
MATQNAEKKELLAPSIEAEISRKRKVRCDQKKARENKWLGKKLNYLSDKNWWRYLIHMPHGGAAAWLLFSFPLVGLAWLVLIIAYQYLEDWRIEDKSYIDMRGYMIGFALAGIIKLIMHYLKWRIL